MSINGRMTHCEVPFLAGQRNAASGNAGLWLFVLGSVEVALCWPVADIDGAGLFFFDLWGEIEAIAL